MTIRLDRLSEETMDMLKVAAAESGKPVTAIVAEILEGSSSPVRQHLELLSETRHMLYQVLAEVEEIKNGLFYLEQTEETVNTRQEAVFDLSDMLLDCIRWINVRNRQIVQMMQGGEEDAEAEGAASGAANKERSVLHGDTSNKAG